MNNTLSNYLSKVKTESFIVYYNAVVSSRMSSHALLLHGSSIPPPTEGTNSSVIKPSSISLAKVVARLNHSLTRTIRKESGNFSHVSVCWCGNVDTMI